MMEEGELSGDWQPVEKGSNLKINTSFNRATFMSKEDNRVNSKLKEGDRSLNGANWTYKRERVISTSNQKEISSYNGMSFISKEEKSSHNRVNPLLNVERMTSYSLKRKSAMREGKTGSLTYNRRKEESDLSKSNLIFKKEKSYDLIEATSLFDTKSSLTDAPISFFTTNPLSKEEEEEEEDKMVPFEKSFLLLNVTSCCLANLPGHSVRRKRSDLKPTSRQRAFSGRVRGRRRCTGESGDQSPDQSLQVRERPKSPLPSLQAGEMRMQELLAKPWNLFLCLILLLPQMAICDIPRCNPENMGDNPFCIPLDYNKVSKVVMNNCSNGSYQQMIALVG